jgi:hypothetical protein
MTSSQEKSAPKPLAYHYPTEGQYGRGVCGTYGMMSADPAGVTCERCRTNTKFLAASNIASRFVGRAP